MGYCMFSIIKDFLLTTLKGGFFVLFPLLLFYLIFDELLDVVVALSGPILEWFPDGVFGEVQLPVIGAVLVLVATSFLLGLMLKLSLLRSLGAWIETNLLEKLPIYTAITRLAKALINVDSKGQNFHPALLSSGDQYELVYLVEEIDDQWMTILVPWSPASISGSIKIVKTASLTVLDKSFGDASMVLGHWGVGMKALLEKKIPKV